jgi:hypothetical protein
VFFGKTPQARISKQTQAACLYVQARCGLFSLSTGYKHIPPPHEGYLSVSGTVFSVHLCCLLLLQWMLAVSLDARWPDGPGDRMDFQKEVTLLAADHSTETQKQQQKQQLSPQLAQLDSTWISLMHQTS